jgi:ubiquinone/menaquinone biosynthesis C-methylase UbiE
MTLSYEEKESYITRDHEPEKWRNHPNYCIMSFYKTIIKGAVADLGCNHGACTALLLDLFPDNKITSIHGFDINYNALQVAYKTAVSLNPSIPVTFLAVNLINIPIEDNKFNFVMSFHTLEHIYSDDAEKFVKEVFRILKPDSYFLISIPYNRAYPDPCHVAFYNVDSLCELFEKYGFQVIECMRDNRWNEKELLTGLFFKPTS